MYFYRILSILELQEKRIHNNQDSFCDVINTHKYKRNTSYVHLFLNAESCFEDFEKEKYTECFIAKFDIPESIVCKYGIGLGSYNSLYNSYNMKYRTVNKNGSFWLPEIAIPSFDFNYNWCCDVSPAVDQKGDCYLPNSFISDDKQYRKIIYDGYLFGFKDQKELLKKYEDMISSKNFVANF